jgi:hypothetical protein
VEAWGKEREVWGGGRGLQFTESNIYSTHTDSANKLE